MSLKEADSLTPQIHLSTIINSLAPSNYKTDRLIITSPTYMTNLSDVLSSTSKEVLQTYFMWKVIQAYASKIEADELKPYSQFVNELQGKVSRTNHSLKSIANLHRTLIRPLSVGEHASITWTMDSAGF
jgi:predicted metalloendopeptidase